MSTVVVLLRNAKLKGNKVKSECSPLSDFFIQEPLLQNNIYYFIF